MPKKERDRFLGAALSPSRKDLKLYLVVLKARLREFEDRYEIRSVDLPRALQEGTIRETRDVRKWVFWAELKMILARETRPESPR